MGGKKVISGENDLKSQNSILASEWNYKKNGIITPDKVALNSNKKVWWMCRKCGYEWEASPNNRNKGTGCPLCSNKVVVKGRNDLLTTNRELCDEWDYNNNSIKPDEVLAGSSKKVWWKCNKCNYGWQATIASRTGNGVGCPNCGKQKQLKSFHKTMIKTHELLFERRPDLEKEWDYSKNNIDPSSLLSGTNKKVWWKCKKCGHEWEATVHSRALAHVGCPLCANKTVKEGINDFSSEHPELLAEWSYEKNDISPNEVVSKSSRKVWWKCKFCGYEWKTQISHRVNGTGCPNCKSRAQTSFPEQAIYFYIKQIFPDSLNRFVEYVDKRKIELDIFIPSVRVAIEYDGIRWHNSDLANEKELKKYKYCKERNIKLIRVKENNEQKNISSLTADEIITCSQHPSYKELDEIIKHIFDVLNVESDVKCEIDSIKIRENYYRDIEKNSIKNKHPELIAEWNFEKNGSLSPNMVSSGSTESIWWRCKKGHEWKVSPSNRVYFNSECPYCSNKKLLKGFNDLKTTNPEVLEAWDYKKNTIAPDDLFYGSTTKVWWKCKLGHEFQCSPYSYVNLKDKKCPVCSGKQVKEGFNDLNSIYPDLALQWNYKKNHINPENVNANSNKKYWWKCDKGHEWEASVISRNRGTSCPFCSNRRVLKGFNDLQTTCPELMEEWNYEKNDILPSTLTEKSSKKVWWKCNKCGYEWCVAPACRNKKQGRSGCPACAGNVVKTGVNDLQTLYPEIAARWDYEMNGDLSPSKVAPKSEKVIWWKCEKGHSYKRTISHETRGYKCPICKSKNKVL